MILKHVNRLTIVAGAAILGLIGWATAPPPAHAAQCMERDAMHAYLDKRFDEKPYAVGLASPTAILEVFVSERGTWTIVTTSPSRLSCLVAAGDSWAEYPADPGPGA